MAEPATLASPRAALPAGHRRKARKPQPAWRGIAIALLVVAYLVAAAVLCRYAASAFFIVLHQQRPEGLTLATYGELWDHVAGDPGERRKLLLCTVGPAAVLFVIVPALLASLGSRRRELHGSARWARGDEVFKAGLLSGGPGIVLGRFNGRYLTLPGQQSVLLSAPTRSGKGVGVVIPNLLAWPDSCVVVDIKGENHARTAGYRAAHGQAVHAWQPFDETGRSAAWNPLSAIRTEPRHAVGDTLAIGQVLYPTNPRGSGSDAFFQEQARNLFLGLVLYLVETPELPRTIGELLRQASGKGRTIKEHLQDVIRDRADDRPLSDACLDALNRFLGTSENTLTSILATLTAPLTVFAEPFVDAATSRDSFSLDDLRRRRLSIYVVIPPNRLADAAVLLNLFFSQALHANTRTLPEQDPTLQHACLFVLDEFTAMGRIGILSSAVGYLAGYNLRLLTVIQAMSQLDDVYGREQARTFATNHGAQILYAPREQRDANEYSEMLGTLTERSESQGRSISSGAKGGGSSHSRNISPQRRPLLLPQEFKEIGSEREVVVIENCKPILADKIRYHDDPVLAARVLAPPEVPLIDFGLHVARVEGRVRPAHDDEAFTLEQLAGDFGRMPRLPSDATPRDLEAWVSSFFSDAAIDAPPEAGPTPADPPALVA